jgi:hypothetical protein
MNSATLKWLAIATVTLFILMIVVDRTDKTDTVSGGEYLIPGLKDRINDITAVVLTGSGDTESVNITRDGDGWQVRDKDGFAADVGKLREVLLALADARKLEAKTANPERFAQLGVAGPDAGNGVLLEISGNNLRHAVIVGNAAQSKNRYVRIADDNQSWLIDRNPDLPANASGWLAPDLLDIETARIRSVSIRHEDGETILLDKTSAEDTSYTVADIPAGRELSYATVANGIAGVLADLKLDDVRRDDDDEHANLKLGDGRRVNAGELTVTSVFTTFDGLEISVRRYQDGDDAWFALSANFVPPAAAVTADADSTPDEAVADDVAIDGEAPGAIQESTPETTLESARESSDAEEPGDSAEEEAATINTRHAGWQYKVADYKANLLARRWDDILKAHDDE